jgi:hypothetical protein
MGDTFDDFEDHIDFVLDIDLLHVDHTVVVVLGQMVVDADIVLDRDLEIKSSDKSS